MEEYTVNGGNTDYGYYNNSSFQKRAIDLTKSLVNEAILEHLDTKIIFPNTFKVVDMGCAVGPNTFHAVQNILDAVILKYQTNQEIKSSDELPEFQVFFNDHISNDFNTLFSNLPQNRQYYAASVAGSFHGRLFPKSSLHFVHSSYSLQALSRVPKDVADKNSPAWNKGRIHIANAKDQVVNAFAAQYVKDMESFLFARAQEVVCGGLMALIFPCRPNGTPHEDVFANAGMNLLGSCLLDMAKKGRFNEEKVDAYNIGAYITSPQELEEIVKQNGFFSIEKMQILPHEMPQSSSNLSRGQVISSTIRAGMEGMIKPHFGPEIIDDLFDLLSKKLDESSIFESAKSLNLFVLLKRMETN